VVLVGSCCVGFVLVVVLCFSSCGDGVCHCLVGLGWSSLCGCAVFGFVFVLVLIFFVLLLCTDPQHPAVIFPLFGFVGVPCSVCLGTCVCGVPCGLVVVALCPLFVCVLSCVVFPRPPLFISLLFWFAFDWGLPMYPLLCVDFCAPVWLFWLYACAYFWY